MKAHYGFSDGSGEYYVTVDTELCRGCGACVPACPRGLFEVQPDDWDEPKATMRRDLVHRLADLCPGHDACQRHLPTTCQKTCPSGALRHSW